MKRLTKQERGELWRAQETDAEALRMWREHYRRTAAAVDPDLPEHVRKAKLSRAWREVEPKLDAVLARMHERRELAKSQARFYTPEAILRRASLAAEPGMLMRVARASDAELQLLAEDAVAEGDLVLAGVVAAEAAGRPGGLQKVRVLASLPLPEREDVGAVLKLIRDPYLEACIAVQRENPDPSPHQGPARLLTLARELKAPVFAPETEKVADGAPLP